MEEQQRKVGHDVVIESLLGSTSAERACLLLEKIYSGLRDAKKHIKIG